MTRRSASLALWAVSKPARRWLGVSLSVLIGLAPFLTGLPAHAAEAPALLLAHTERGQAQPGLYLVSEKLDGVRALWDGQALRTRQGNVIPAPRWFTAGFPARALDGELWIDRGQFDRLSATVRRQTPVDAEWRQVRFMAFELPDAPGIFRQRNEALGQLIAQAQVPWLQHVAQRDFTSRSELQQLLAATVQAGGEGLMLHRADAPYLTGRSDALLKMKPLHDAEATVIAHLPGKGKHLGRLGALRVRTPEGVEFSLGTGLTDALRDHPPPLGSVVTYRYRDTTPQGKPRFASFWRVRQD